MRLLAIFSLVIIGLSIGSFLAIECFRQEINKDKVVILAFIDSRKDISEILRTSKEITDADVGIEFHLIDVFVEPELAGSYAIKSTPEFIVLVSGTFLTRTNNLEGACMIAISEAVRIMRNNKRMTY